MGFVLMRSVFRGIDPPYIHRWLLLSVEWQLCRISNFQVSPANSASRQSVASASHCTAPNCKVSTSDLLYFLKYRLTKTSAKGTMDPEGARLLTYYTVGLQYASPVLFIFITALHRPPCCNRHSAAHRAAASDSSCTFSEGSMSSLKRTLITEMIPLRQLSAENLRR